MTKTACVFPGQGSQSVGMLKELAETSPIIEATFKEASDALGYDLWDLVQNDADGKLNETHITQPALLAASVAIWRSRRAGQSVPHPHAPWRHRIIPGVCWPTLACPRP